MKPSIKIWKTRFLQTLTVEFSQYVRRFRLTVLQNHHWNTIRTRHLWQIKICYDLFNHLKVTEILCSFRLVLEGKTGKEIPESSRLQFLKKFSANNFVLSEAEGNTSWPLNRGGIADLPLLRTLLTIFQKVLRTKFLGSCGLFCFISICKFDSFKNPFATIASLSELYFRFRRFILLVQTKKVISMNYGSSTSS